MGLIIPPLADVILADVHERHAGAASGVVNTAMQVGNAIGVAIVGVILFAALGSHAASSAAKAHVPVPQRACFVDRMQEEDPAAVPASCRGVAPSPAFAQARQDDFVAAIERALLYEIGVFAVTFGLLVLLPAGARRPAAERTLVAT
jgi:hypothetical protein